MSQKSENLRFSTSLTLLRSYSVYLVNRQTRTMSLIKSSFSVFWQKGNFMLPFAVNVMLNLSNIIVLLGLARCKMIITNSDLCIFWLSITSYSACPWRIMIVKINSERLCWENGWGFSKPILIQVYPCKQGWLDLPQEQSL